MKRSIDDKVTLSYLARVKGETILRALIDLAFWVFLYRLNTIAIYKKQTCNTYSTSSTRTVWSRKMQMRLFWFFMTILKMRETDSIKRISCLFCPVNMLNVNGLARLNPLPLKDGLKFWLCLWTKHLPSSLDLSQLCPAYW